MAVLGYPYAGVTAWSSVFTHTIVVLVAALFGASSFVPESRVLYKMRCCIV